MASIRALHASEVPEICGYPEPRILNQWRKLTQAHYWHAHHGRRDAQTRLDSARMVPDRCRDASDVRFMLLQIAGVTVFPDTAQLSHQFLETTDRVGCHPLHI